MSAVKAMAGVMALLMSSGCSVLDKPRVLPPIQPAVITELPTIELNRPALMIHSLSLSERNQNDLLVKAYVASLRQMIDYAEALEKVVDQLQQLHLHRGEP